MATIIRLQTFLIVLIISLSLNGCGTVPWPFSVVHTAADIMISRQTGKSTSEHAWGKVIQKDCQWSRLFSDWKLCLTKEEYVDNLTKMNCDTYAWNFLNIPYCKESQ